MSGIGEGFTAKYLELKKNGLSKEEINVLKKDLVENEKGSNTNEISKLKAEIFKDGKIDENEAKLLVTIGFSLDENEAKNVQKHLSPPSDKTVSDLFDKGIKAAKKAVEDYEKHSPNKSAIRDGAKAALGFVDKAFNTSTASSVYNASQAVKVNNQGVVKKLEQTLENLKGSAQKSECIEKGLQSVGFSDIKSGSEKVTEKFLEDKTHKPWTGISLNNNNLQELLKDQKGKALITIGNHVYKFEGFKDGKISYSDPSAKDPKAISFISKNQVGVNIFAQGEKNVTNKADTSAITRNAKSYNNINKDVPINSSDKKTGNKESFEIRKLLLLTGDPDSKETAKSIFNAVDKKDIGQLKEILSKNKIKLDDQELKAFITSMKTPMKTDHGNSLLDEMKWLNDNGGKWTNSKVNYNVGVMYSDIDLSDYFTKTNTKDIYKNFQDLLAGKEGC